MIRNLQIPLFDLAMSLSDAMDLVSEKLADHHKGVAEVRLAKLA